MSATPIPRSLALSLYGDLDLSLIKEKPPLRKDPVTLVIKEAQKDWIYNFVKEKLNEGRQAFFVFSLIEDSEFSDLLSLEKTYEKIKNSISEFKVEKLHGSMKKNEKEKIVKDFINKKIQVLVTTTVVEVGLDIENATVMVVENPEKFGLAQLHQLRGRIQRSQYPSYFILVLRENISENAKKRIEILKNTNDGFRIAEEDLILRGPGDFFGLRQSGMPKLRIAHPLKDLEILREARKIAYEVIKDDPSLLKPYNKVIKKYINFWLRSAQNST